MGQLVSHNIVKKIEVTSKRIKDCMLVLVELVITYDFCHTIIIRLILLVKEEFQLGFERVIVIITIKSNRLRSFYREAMNDIPDAKEGH